jgi:hypothetical protein
MQVPGLAVAGRPAQVEVPHEDVEASLQKTPDTGLTSIRAAKLGNAYAGQPPPPRNRSSMLRSAYPPGGPPP